MPSPTTIRRLDVTPLDIPLRKPFGIAGGAQVTAHNVLVRVELADGTEGHGEAAPFPSFNGETQPQAIAAARSARPAVEGQDVRGFRKLAAVMRPLVGESASAQCAIETAILDALARQAGLPLWALFGGAELSLITDVTITVGSTADARAEAEAWTRAGFSRLKIKIGAAPLAEDLARITAIHDIAPDAGLILDGNGGLSAEAALTLIAELRARDITPILFEQPVPGADLRGLAEVTRRAGVPVAADESVVSASSAHRIARDRLAHVINIKPMKCGLVEALEIAAVAKAAGLGLMIGGMVEARLAMSASACLAAGFGGFSFVDLDTPLFLAEDPFEGGYAQQGERLDLSPITMGHGVRPRR
jgi:L-alanine-DL-glutamate epimerase-like enolase superfamily enzyme